MKNIFFLFVFTLSITFLSAQIFIDEDFSGSFPPEGWTNSSSQFWELSTSNNAGGITPELESTIYSGGFRFISPEIDLTNLNAINLLFNHYLNYSNGNYQLQVHTRSGGGDWSVAWSMAVSGDISAEELTINISNSDVGATDFQFCFYVSGGPSATVDFWYIDDVKLIASVATDVSFKEITSSNLIVSGSEITGLIQNLGSELVESVGIDWKVDGGDIYHTSIENLNLAYSEETEFVITPAFDYPIGEYTISAWVQSVNGGEDQNLVNDSVFQETNVVSYLVYRRPCFEIFTSSTCGPCVAMNESFVPFADERYDSLTYIKYQMNWPYAGDPYYTAQAGARGAYYDVSAVPTVNINGIYGGWQFPNLIPLYNEQVNEPGVFKMASDFNMNGSEITVNTEVLPFTNLENLSVYTIVFENMTTENTGTNGETEFFHVMMKMLPNASGEQASFVDRETASFAYNFDMASTFVEEMDDLNVIIFVQNNETKEIYQSTYSIQDSEFNDDATLSNILIDGEPLPNFSPSQLQYDIELASGSMVPEITYVKADENATAIVVDALGLPGTSTIDVFAENLTEHNLYEISFELEVGVEHAELNNTVRVYPNPSSGYLNVYSDEKLNIEIFDMQGNIVKIVKGHQGNINIGDLESGAYILKTWSENTAPTATLINLIK